MPSAPATVEMCPYVSGWRPPIPCEVSFASAAAAQGSVRAQGRQSRQPPAPPTVCPGPPWASPGCTLMVGTLPDHPQKPCLRQSPPLSARDARGLPCFLQIPFPMRLQSILEEQSSRGRWVPSSVSTLCLAPCSCSVKASQP